MAPMALIALLAAVCLAGVVLGVLAYLRLQRTAREVADQATGLRSAIGAVLQRLPPSGLPRFVYLQNGRAPRGPVDLSTLRAMHLDGRLPADTLIAVAGSDDWRPLGEWLADEA